MIDRLFSAMDWYNTYISGPILPCFLICAGIFMTCYLKFFYILHPVKLIRALLTPSDGGTSPFKAVTMALAGTLGVGNIIGVAAAIAAGGPGAVFWMWVSALAAMALKYAEIVLAVVYRRVRDQDGQPQFYGGAMYYIMEGLRKSALKLKNTRTIGCIFAVFCILNSLTTGNILQVNAAAAALPFPTQFTGILFAILVGIVIIGGVKRISDLTLRLIPILTGIYIALSLYILLTNAAQLSAVLTTILRDAFDFGSASSGILAFFFSRTIRFGVTRGILSNEAGSGTAPTAHAAANVQYPATQGCWGIFEVFADTILLCTLTAFVILLSYDELVLIQSLDGIALTIAAYHKYTGPAADLILIISVPLFAYATVICQAYYGQEALNFLTPSSNARRTYILLYLACIVTGSIITTQIMWTLADFTVTTMTILNTVCLLLLAPQIKKETQRDGWGKSLARRVQSKRQTPLSSSSLRKDRKNL